MLTSSLRLPSSLRLHQFHPTKNPNKILNSQLKSQFQPQIKPQFKPQFQPQFKPYYSHSTTKIMSSSSPSSWSCSNCTFLNPPSQKSNCQICLTPFSSSSILPNSSSSSLSPQKWSCKACTFLNSYSRSNCEICDTRNSLSNLDSNDPDDDLVGSNSVGSVFFPLRRCNSGQVQESGDVGVENRVQTQMGTNQIVDHYAQINEVLKSCSNKRKFRDPVSENADAVAGKKEENADAVAGKKEENADAVTGKKEENAVVRKDLTSSKIANNTEANVKSKRKLSDLGDFIETKSSKKTLSVLDFVNNTGSENVSNIKSYSSASTEITETAEHKEASNAIKILTYNVWFREDLELHKRMQAIGNLIQLHSPDVICFQEVTPDIYVIFQSSKWWKNYRCSVSYERVATEAYFCMQMSKLPVKSFSCKQFSYSAMGRELCVAEVEVNQSKSLVVATSHLESPCPGPPTWDQMFSKERVNQAKDAINILQSYPNVIFCGDMNWDDKLDGRFPYVEGWFDAWEKLRPADIGYTYDTKSNIMLSKNRTLQKRLDRFICRLTDFEVSCIDMIGTEAIPGLEYIKQKKLKNKIQDISLPVYPSDHFGLLLTITRTK